MPILQLRGLRLINVKQCVQSLSWCGRAWIKTNDSPISTSGFTATVIFFFNWSVVAIQCHVGFCYTKKWIFYMYTYVRSLLGMPLIPHPTPLGHHKALSWAPYAYSMLSLAVCFTHSIVHMPIPISQLNPTHSTTTIFTCLFPTSVSLFLPCR